MADHPNVALIRKLYEAFGPGDMETVNEVFGDDIGWHVTGRNLVAGDYRGKDEVFRFFGKLAELKYWQDETLL